MRGGCKAHRYGIGLQLQFAAAIHHCNAATCVRKLNAAQVVFRDLGSVNRAVSRPAGLITPKCPRSSCYSEPSRATALRLNSSIDAIISREILNDFQQRAAHDGDVRICQRIDGQRIDLFSQRHKLFLQAFACRC